MAYCSNCGNYVSDSARFCESCGCKLPKRTTPTYGYLYNKDTIDGPITGTYGLFGAILSAILGYIGIIFACVSSVVGIEAVGSYVPSYYDYYDYYIPGHYDEELATVALVFGLIGITLTGMAIIFGARSIGDFNYARREADRKPIGTLIVGINGLVMGAIGALFAVIGTISAIGCFY